MHKFFLSAVCLAGAGMVCAQTGTKGGEWHTYGGDLGSTRYAPLAQINASNFSNLEVAWRFRTESLGPRPEYQFESTPLMVRGKLYTTAGSRRSVVCLDAVTGELYWVHSEVEGERGSNAARQLSGHPDPAIHAFELYWRAQQLRDRCRTQWPVRLRIEPVQQ